MAKLCQMSQPLIAIAIIKGFGSGAIAPIPPEVIAIAATTIEAAITATEHCSIATTAEYVQEDVVVDFRVVAATVIELTQQGNHLSSVWNLATQEHFRSLRWE